MAETPHRADPLRDQIDGPVARWLDAVVLATGLLDGMTLDRREDLGAAAWAAGTVQYLGSEGGYVNATVQRTPRRLDAAVFTYGGECEVELLDSGAEAVVREVEPGPTGSAQVILRRPDGVIAQVTAGGVIGRGARRPLSRDQVRMVAMAVDGALSRRPPRRPEERE